MKKILDFCEISGSSVKRYEGKRKYIATGDILDNKIISFEEVDYEHKPSRANQNVEIGDVIFAKMQNTKKVIIITKENVNNIYSTGFYVIKPKENVTSKFLFWLFNSKKFNYDKDKNCKGATQKAINNEGLNKIEIKVLPTIQEQLEIINKLDKTQEIIDIRKEQIKHLDELIKSQFVEMFGDIKNTKYEVMKLENITNLITDGEHKKPNYTDKGKPFISVINITTGDLKFDDCKFVSEEDTIKFQKRCNPKNGDILYTKVGATYGRSAIVDTDRDFSLYVSVCLIKPKKELINPIFLNYTMKQPYVKAQADKCIKGIGVPDLHLIEIKNFNIIVPPLDLQNKFADFVKQIDKQKFNLQKSLEEIQKLQESLMNKYFR